jgi:Uma2 family endonuclease
LVVEIADSSLPTDRLTKATIYAAAGIAEYWIVNLRDGVVEVLRDPDRAARQYREATRVPREGRLTLAAFEAVVAVDALLPARRR